MVSWLQYEIHGWLGDDLLESFPCFIVTRKLADQMLEASLTGFELHPVDVVLSDEAEDLADEPIELPEFRWLRPETDPGGDLAVDGSGLLIVSERALEVMRQSNLSNCDIEEIEE
jgi:hypothetical protein